MTNPTAAPTEGNRAIAEAPEAATLRGSLNGDVVPTGRPVTRADDQTGTPSATAPSAATNGVSTSDVSADPDDEEIYWEEWHGNLVGYTICRPENFETRTR